MYFWLLTENVELTCLWLDGGWKKGLAGLAGLAGCAEFNPNPDFAINAYRTMKTRTQSFGAQKKLCV
jgi:hypothetical protein